MRDVDRARATRSRASERGPWRRKSRRRFRATRCTLSGDCAPGRRRPLVEARSRRGRTRLVPGAAQPRARGRRPRGTRRTSAPGPRGCARAPRGGGSTRSILRGRGRPTEPAARRRACRRRSRRGRRSRPRSRRGSSRLRSRRRTASPGRASRRRAAATSAAPSNAPTNAGSTTRSGLTSRIHGASRARDALRGRDAVARVERIADHDVRRRRARARRRRASVRAVVDDDELRAARPPVGPMHAATRRTARALAAQFQATTTALMRGAVMSAAVARRTRAARTAG